MKKRFCEYFHSTDCLRFYHKGNNNILSLIKKSAAKKKRNRQKKKKKKELKKKKRGKYRPFVRLLPIPSFFFITCPRLDGRISLQDINSHGRHQRPISNICDQKR